MVDGEKSESDASFEAFKMKLENVMPSAEASGDATFPSESPSVQQQQQNRPLYADVAGGNASVQPEVAATEEGSSVGQQAESHKKKDDK